MRVALYARVSTDEQAIHGLSIDAQLAALREWAKDKSIVDEYVDLGVSARKPILKRQELQRLLRDVEQGKIDTIAFTKLDRWTRNVREYYKAQDVLDAHNVSWRAIHEDYETETAAGRLKVNIMLAVAQDEADRTSERIKAVFEDKRRKGLVPTGSVPLGIRLEAGKYVPSDEAHRARDIFLTFIATRSPTETARRHGMTANGIRYLLRNETYKTAGVIDGNTWDTAQSILRSRAQRMVRTDRVYLFSGLLICPHCGSHLTVVRVDNYVYYRCPRHFDGMCPGIHVSELKIEAFLLSQLLPAVEGYNLKLTRKQKKPVSVQNIQRKLDKLTDLYLEDKISKEEYDARSEPLRDALKSAHAAPKTAPAEEIRAALDVYPTLTRAAKKAFWSALVQSVTPKADGFDFALIYT